MKPRRLKHFVMDYHGKKDFYGEHMRLVLVGYIRPEVDFTSVEELALEIQGDIDVANELLDVSPYKEVEFQTFSELPLTKL